MVVSLNRKIIELKDGLQLLFNAMHMVMNILVIL